MNPSTYRHNKVAASELRRLVRQLEELADEIESVDPEHHATSVMAEQIVRHAEDWMERARNRLED